MASLKNIILEKIKKRGKGYIFFPQTFRDMGDYEGVKLALHRLVNQKEILRLAKGIYYYPKIDPELGVMLPSLEDIAEAIAKRDHIKIRPTGAKAMNQLGLSTQVPLNVVYITNGPSKKIQIGKNIIHFKNATNRQMALKEDTIGNIIFALLEIGQFRLTPELIQEVYKLLSLVDPADIIAASKKGPPWISDFLVRFLKQQNDQMVTTPPGTTN